MSDRMRQGLEKRESHELFVFHRALEILAVLADQRDVVDVPTLCKLTGLHRSSAYRYLRALIEDGYVARNGEGRYRLGCRLFELARLALEHMDIRRIAHPLLVRLSEATETTVHLARLDGPEVVYIDKVETERSLPLRSRVGGRAPAHCTGVGKALLAFTERERACALVSRVEFKPFTAATIRDAPSLLADLELARRRGYTVDAGEHEEGIHCVAAPVLDPFGEVAAAVSVTDLARRIDARLTWYAASVIKTCTEIETAFSGGEEWNG